MIGRLAGKLLQKQPPSLLVDVGGVGYEVEAPMSTICNLPEVGGEIVLVTHMVVRDDAHLLFAFGTLKERHLFRSLLKVNGVGAKLALMVLSGMEVEEFARCVESGDAVRLTKLPGVGKKTAERLVVEMKDRLTEDINLPAMPVPSSKGGSVPTADPVADAVSGLVALGYKPPEASRFVAAMDTVDMTTEDIIREVLRARVQ